MVTLVSLVIVNWKTPQLLLGCLRSVSADQNSSQFEIIVIDNASNDGSVELIQQEFPNVKIIANQNNVGFSKACNQAIPVCTGKYILLLNPDTLAVDNAISTMANFMDSHPNCGACGPRVLNPDGTLQLACRRAFPTPAAAFYRLSYLSRLFPNHPTFAKYNLSYADENQLLSVDALSGSCMMVRQEVISKIGLLDEDIFMFGEDIDWCWRIKQSGYTVFYVPEAKVYHYHGASSQLRPIGATINLHKGMAVFYRKHMASSRKPWFNCLVYTAIWLRATIFIIINSIKMMIPRTITYESVPILNTDK